MGIEVFFEPITIGNLQLRNRFVMSPMSRYSCPGRVPNTELLAYYRRRAEGDVGLIYTGAAAIDRPAANNSPVLADFRPICYPVWRCCVDAVHEAGGLIAIQLWHAGGWFRIAPDYKPAPLESPSGLGAPGKTVGEAMSEQAIADTIAEFGKAAASARDLGFDAIELHAAHGFLIDQFFWAETNHRSDQWGGPHVADRVNFATAVIREVRAAVGPDMVVSIRISQWKEQDYGARIAETPDELQAWVEPLADAGVDVLNCSQRRFWEPEFEGSDLNLAGWVKKITGKPTITVGSVGLDTEVMSFFNGAVAQPTPLDALVERFERGEFDLVAVARALLADPEWVHKVQDGTYTEIQPFDKSKADIVY
jgi:2,4-dienoyl-CoA reductase-like NADH-dependent reductase (Old Yellow Enzyme family)